MSRARHTALAALVLVGAATTAGRAPAAGAAPAASSPPVAPPPPPPDPFASARVAVRAFTDKTGLPQNSVTSLAEDRDGLLWVGTQDGLAIYDGRGFRRVPLPPGAHTVHQIVFGADDRVYIGTGEAGVVELRLPLSTSVEHPPVYDTDHDLSSNEVFAILERGPGGAPRELWVGTDDGLARRVGGDGGVWTKMTKVDGLPSSHIGALAETREGDQRTLWAGTGRGLARFDAATGKWSKVEAAGLSGSVYALAPTRGASSVGDQDRPALWVAGKSGVCRFEGGVCTVSYGADVGFDERQAAALLESLDVHGRPVLRVGTAHHGVFALDERIGEGHAPPEVLDETTGLPGNPVMALAIARGHDGAGHGATPTPRTARTLWVGLNSRGLARVELGSWRAIDSAMGLPSPSVYSVLESIDAGVPTYWIGTLAGLVRLEPPRPGATGPAVHAGSAARWVDTGLTHDPVLCMMQSKRDGAVWVGVDGGVARMKDGKTTWWHEKDGLPGTGLLHLLESTSPSGAERVWAATQEGLALIEDGKVLRSWRVENGLPSDVVISLAETVKGTGERTLWVGTMLGLATVDERSFEVTKRSLGTIGAIGSGADPGKQFILSLLVEGDDADGVKDQAERGATTLWVGTKAGPLRARIRDDDDSPRFEPLPEAVLAKLPNLVVNQLLRDAKHRLYVFTNHGVARLSPRQPDAADRSDTHVEVFGAEDGLPSSECNTGAAMFDSKGRLWAGTAEGVGLFDPAGEIVDHTPKPLSFERIASGSVVRVAASSGVTLPHDRANVTYTYALASFFKEAETRYRTELVGWDPAPSEWTADGKRELSNLPAGSYTFKVWGRDWAGNVSGPIVDRFDVKAAPWRTPWAYASYALLALLAGFGVVRLRERSLLAKNAELEASVKARTRELDDKALALAANNDALASSVEQLRAAEQRAEAKAAALDENVGELRRLNQQLALSQVQADRIFSALAEALPGTVLEGKYRLDVKIGAGGFGAVFRATHLALKRPVAVKVFRPSAGNDSADAVERFRREGEKASLLRHPSAVRVFDAGVSSDGIAYIVMEMLTGHTLSDELAEAPDGKLTVLRTFQVLGAVADVLSEAHAIGLIHRDIKPSNIFLHRDGDGEIVKVVDFGLAKLVDADSGEDDQMLTRTGRIVGTPAYMAPERLGARTSDIASDVYSLGVVVYEMLAGQTPFKESGQNLVALLMAHLREGPQNLRTHRPDLSVELDAAVMSALAADPANRPTVDELASRFAAAAGLVYVKHAQRVVSGSHVAPPTSTFASRALRDADTIDESGPQGPSSRRT